VVLPALPLNPSGKVDRRALPAPEPFRDPRGFVGPRDPLERDLVAVWEELLGVTSISVTDNFFDLGGHSLAAIRLFDRITQRLGTRLPPSALFQSPTIEQLAAAIRTLTTPADGPLVAIQPRGTKPPLFCIHGLGGSVVGFRDLSACLGDDQPLYGLQALGVDGRHRPHTRIEDMASHYLGEIRRVQPHGPYRLAGWSLGGCIAVEIARLLRADGEAIGMIAFLDAPVLGIPTRLFPVEAASYRLRNAARTAKMHRRHLRAKQWRNKPAYLIDALKSQIEAHPSDVTAAQRLALRRYRPAPFEGSAVLFRTRSSVETSWRGGAFGWEHVISGPIDVHDVPGEHLTLLRKPHVEVLARRLQEYL
jgi:thioesterase domain-containing protein/acyl carrier protein